MKLILAQGNPGTPYQHTRHNAGFMLLSQLVAELGGNWKEASKWKALMSEHSINGEKVLFVLPQSFYNETGSVARGIVDFYKLEPSTDVLVIHDDLSLPFGTIRTREKGSDGGNNGIKSLNATLGEQYARLRVGIWNELRERMSDADFVLRRFTAEEEAKLKNDIAHTARQLIDDFINGTQESTSRKV
jgi:peptidyl-tRNA hydrolase, PTH1 family